MTDRNNADLFVNETGNNQNEAGFNGQHQSQKKKKIKAGSFESFNLSPATFKGIKKQGYNLPTPIQRKAIPTILEGFNVIAMARTGSGKTGAFIIPIIEKLKQHSKIVGTRCIILSPTREIAMQTASFFKALSKFTDLTFVLITGGNEMENQFERLVLNPDVIIATPGRLMHCIQETGLQLNAVELVVYDECDRLFEMGFAEQIKELTDKMPKFRQSLLFSATISSQVRDFALSGIKDYKMLQVDKDSKLSDDLKIHFFVVRSGEKTLSLIYIMKELIEFQKPNQQTIIFAATRHHVEYLHEICQKSGFKTTFIYGAMDQRTRADRLLLFRNKKVNFLIVTDLAARGIDIPLLDNVIHYDFPPKMKIFIHRSGRTARNGQKGTSYSIITREETPYLHDLSIFVGRQYYDQETETETLNEILNNPQKICYGKLPQSVIDEYSLQIHSLHDKYPTVLEPLEKSMKLSLLKYNKNKDPASLTAVSAVRELAPKIHPMLATKVDAIEEELNDFKENLKNFKPKQSILEIGIIKTFDQEKISKFQSALSLNNEKRQQKVERKKYHSIVSNQFEKEQQIHDKKLIELINQDKQNDQKLKQIHEENKDKHKLSKKLRQKIQKIEKDDTLTQKEKESLISQLQNNGLQKKQKRSQLNDFRDPKAYIDNERKQDMQDGKVNQSKLWGEDEKNFLEDVTINLVADDEAHMDIKGKTVSKWDSKKKRHVLVKVDREGKVIKEKRNESGAKITKKNAMKNQVDQKVYKRWMKKTHLRLQSVGEVENKKAVEVAKSSTESRKMMKQFRSKHKDLNKGEDARSNGHLVKMKKKKLLEKMRKGGKSGGKNQRSDKNGKNYGDKSWNKIVQHSKPTRSRVITKRRN